MGRSSNRSRGRDDDIDYRSRARDRIDPQMRRRFDGDNHLEDLRPARPRRPTSNSTKHLERKATEPLQAKIDEIFKGSIDPSKALEFVKNFGRFCPVVLLADMLSRIGDRMVNNSVLAGRDILPLMPVMEKLFECFTEADKNLQPRELSTCIRLMGRYHQYLEHRRGEVGITQKDPKRMEAIFDKLLSMWERARVWESPNIIDFSGAIIGMVTSRRILAHRVSALSGNAPTLADVLKNTCDQLCSDAVEIGPKEALHLAAKMRTMVLEAVVSKELIRRLHDYLWRQDAMGHTTFDIIEAPHNEILAAKITALFCASACNLFHPEALKGVEAELATLVASGQHSVVTLEMIGEFLSASLLYNQRPAAALIDALERRAPEALAQMPVHSAQTMRATYFATLSFMTLQSTPLESTLSMARAVSGMTLGKISRIEHRVNQVLKDVSAKRGWHYSHGDTYGPCKLDCRVTIRTAEEDVTVNLEVDGFPYHSVYLIDEKRFSDTELPLRNVLRDMLIREGAGYRIVRIMARRLCPTEGESMTRTQIAETLVDAITRAAGI
jgi:hypothetical protein